MICCVRVSLNARLALGLDGNQAILIRITPSPPSSISTLTGSHTHLQTIDINGKKVKLQIWDTAGQERFRTITQSYFRGAQGILLVFDVMDRAAFNNVRTWMESIDAHADKSVNRILIGNKCDMPDRVSSMCLQQRGQATLCLRSTSFRCH